MSQYRFFEFKTEDGFEDYTQADYLSDAKLLFEKLYPGHKGVVREVLVSEFNKYSKNFKKGNESAS